MKRYVAAQNHATFRCETRKDTNRTSRPLHPSSQRIARKLPNLSATVSKKSRVPLLTVKTFHEYMEERVKGSEDKTPWFLEDKEEAYKYLEERGFRTPRVLRRFDTPSEIDLHGLPSEFVLKPTRDSSTRGVMVLSRCSDSTWIDALRGQEYAQDGILNYQSQLFSETDRPGNRLIVEEKLYDVEDYIIPRDFKVYAFRGIIALMAIMNRNVKPIEVSWFDNFCQPVDDGRVWSNPKYVTEVPTSAPDGAWQMLRVATQVSASLPTAFARVDMYLTKDGPVIGEVTLTPGGFYFGQHYQLAQRYQRLFGRMWHAAEMDALL